MHNPQFYFNFNEDLIVDLFAGGGSHANAGFGFAIKCRKCGARAGSEAGAEEAATAWNTRPLEDAKDKEIEWLLYVLESIRFEHPDCFEDADCPHNGGAGYDTVCLRCPWVMADEVLKEGEEE